MNGDQNFDEIYRRNSRSVVRYFLRLGFSADDAADLAQEVFTHAYKMVSQIPPGDEFAVIKRIAQRLAYNRFRELGTKKREGVAGPALEMAIAAGPDELSDLILRNELNAAIATLPPSLKAPQLLWLDGHKYAEIAVILGITVDAVKARLRDARIRLREVLDVTDFSADDHDLTGDVPQDYSTDELSLQQEIVIRLYTEAADSLITAAIHQLLASIDFVGHG